MVVKRKFITLLLAVLLLVFSACDGESASGAQKAIEFSSNGLTVTYRTDPNPPIAGKNVAYATVKSENGAPITDAHIAAVYNMPAMPSMNMPEMRNTFQLTHQKKGAYQGTGELVMGGTWNVTVEVTRSGQVAAVHRFTVVAKNR